MSKEALRGVARIIKDSHDNNEWQNGDYSEGDAEDIMTFLWNLGYRKLPEGEPPLLSEEEISSVCSKTIVIKAKQAGQMQVWMRIIAQAQREADIKWIKGV